MAAFRAQDIAQMTAVPAIACDEVAFDQSELPAPLDLSASITPSDDSNHGSPVPLDLLKVPIL